MRPLALGKGFKIGTLEALQRIQKDAHGRRLSHSGEHANTGRQGMNEEPNLTEWRDYQRLVLSQLEELNVTVKELSLSMYEHKTELAVIRAKAGLIGSFAAAIVVIISSIIEHFRR
jgi:hypothetical protein